MQGKGPIILRKQKLLKPIIWILRSFDRISKTERSDQALDSFQSLLVTFLISKQEKFYYQVDYGSSVQIRINLPVNKIELLWG